MISLFFIWFDVTLLHSLHTAYLLIKKFLIICTGHYSLIVNLTLKSFYSIEYIIFTSVANVGKIMSLLCQNF